MFAIIKSIIEDLLALFFSGSILMFGVSELYLTLQKEVFRKVNQGGPSLTKITEGLTCQKFDEKMNLVKVASGHCGNKIK